MRRLLIGIFVVVVAGVLVRVVELANTVSAANDFAPLTALTRPTGFLDATLEAGCPSLSECFRTDAQLQNMTRQDASALVSQFGIAVSAVGCRSGSNGGESLTCSGKGTITGSNNSTIQVVFSVVSGAEINTGGSQSPPPGPGTYVTFSTAHLKRLA